jgi:flagellar biogenesis protein FliO
MPDYRDPKVTETAGKKNDMMKWIGIAIAVLLALLLLAWLLGWFAEDQTEVELIDPAVIEEPIIVE